MGVLCLAVARDWLKRSQNQLVLKRCPVMNSGRPDQANLGSGCLAWDMKLELYGNIGWFCYDETQSGLRQIPNSAGNCCTGHPARNPPLQFGGEALL
jgi:hypothetical protein